MNTTIPRSSGRRLPGRDGAHCGDDRAGATQPDDPTTAAADDFSPYVTKDGGISRPTDYRDTFLHLGTFAVATKPSQPLDEMHNVYARPGDIRAYRQDGKFPDGAVLVKEVTRVGSEKLTTGQSHWSTDVKLWFVMVKDSKGRSPATPCGATAGAGPCSWRMSPRNVATDHETDCKTCHIPARKDDWVYIRGYPVLGRHAPAP